mmetsp:Transcript_113113/g.196414  ORF Transcript_113113/g.196414 Transcript_113113/m.196414 type:complete len:195 (-) Transcript_113113:511-1095(-)
MSGAQASSGTSSSKGEKPSDEGDTPDFECNICFETAKEPVVTVCGHLFCWSCLFQWIERQPECPVCKAGCDRSNIIPLYGRGNAKKENQGADIPLRPAGQRPENTTQRTRWQGGQHFGSQFHFGFFGFPFMGFTFGNMGAADPFFGGGQHPPRNLSPQEQEEVDAENRSRTFLFVGVVILAYLLCFSAEPVGYY